MGSEMEIIWIKSSKGIKTPQPDVELIKARLKYARKYAEDNPI